MRRMVYRAELPYVKPPIRDISIFPYFILKRFLSLESCCQSLLSRLVSWISEAMAFASASLGPGTGAMNALR